jgi:hypothetical protein
MAILVSILLFLSSEISFFLLMVKNGRMISTLVQFSIKDQSVLRTNHTIDES